jgi:hypothetical protein
LDLLDDLRSFLLEEERLFFSSNGFDLSLLSALEPLATENAKNVAMNRTALKVKNALALNLLAAPVPAVYPLE